MSHATRILALLIGATVMAGATAQDRLWNSAEPIEHALASLSPAAIEAWRVSLRSDLVAGSRSALVIPLPGRGNLRARLEQVFRHDAPGLTWAGTIEGESGQVILARRGESISGSIRTRSAIWEVQPGAGHDHVLIRVDPDGYPICGGGIEAPNTTPHTASRAPGSVADEARAPLASSSGEKTVIDVLALYSEEARQQAGGTEQIEATAQAAIDHGNVALDQSLTDVRWNIVAMAEIDHPEEGGCGDRLVALSTSPAAAILRDRYSADMVGMLLASTGNACGCGFVMRNPGPDFAGSAFQVTSRGCAVGGLTYAHEHGHNSGMEHDPDNGTSPPNASHPWSFGHFVNGKFRTVMSYASPCTVACPRQAFFSNPDVTYQHAPTGIEDERDNARTALLTAPIIAAFRERPVDLSIDPTAFELWLAAGETETFTLTLTNGGTAQLDWSITASPASRPDQPSSDGWPANGTIPWLDFDIESGSIAAGDQVEITLTVDTGELPIGEQAGRIDIASNDPEQPEASVPITLQVLHPTILHDRFESLR